jgi:hypothetical protein
VQYKERKTSEILTNRAAGTTLPHPGAAGRAAEMNACGSRQPPDEDDELAVFVTVMPPVLVLVLVTVTPFPSVETFLVTCTPDLVQHMGAGQTTSAFSIGGRHQPPQQNLPAVQQSVPGCSGFSGGGGMGGLQHASFRSHWGTVGN